MSLTKKETEFCRYFCMCRNAREAAAKAGFAFPERSGMRLLSRETIRSEIQHISGYGNQLSSATDGLRRIAFGSIADAVRLVMEQDTSALESLDLFMVSEIKRTDKGGMELKFYDRIKALEALSEIGGIDDDKSSVPFIEAIFKGAEAIEGFGSVSDEV